MGLLKRAYEFATGAEILNIVLNKIRKGNSGQSIIAFMRRKQYPDLKIKKIFQKAIDTYYVQELEVIETSLAGAKYEGKRIRQKRRLEKRKEALEIEMSANLR